MISCRDGATGSRFTVRGVITNHTARMIYLEEVPATGMQPMLVDSVTIGKDGKFTLTADPEESVVFNLRLDQHIYPVASVINDAPVIDINIQLSKENNQFAETYEVKSSPASQEMKDFMVAFNNDLQKIFVNDRQADSLRNAGVADSVLLSMLADRRTIAQQIKRYSEQAFARANNPALLLFELGYYQSTANASNFGLEPLSNEQVSEIVGRSARQFPAHNGMAAVNTSLQKQMQQLQEQAERKKLASWIGKKAPDFSLPDINGRQVKLSSFRGRYVLVDFWASWCGPCRNENPNVVNAYQRYKDKNFTVLGVSLDRPGAKEQWMKAIRDDKLDWTHVSDLQFWNSPVVPLYGLEGIPFNVLVDPDGKVVAEGLRGPDLAAKLEELLN